MAVNKVVRSNGTTLIDISDTTATEDDVAEGKILYLADGTRAVGRKGGESEPSYETIVPLQTINCTVGLTNGAYGGYINPYTSFTEEGEKYRVIFDGTTYEPLTATYYGSGTSYLYVGDINVEASSSTTLAYPFEILLYNGQAFYLGVKGSGTHTLQVDKITSEGGGSSATLITKTITANGTYSAEDDDADGYSEVTVNVPSGGSSGLVYETGTYTAASNGNPTISFSNSHNTAPAVVIFVDSTGEAQTTSNRGTFCVLVNIGAVVSGGVPYSSGTADGVFATLYHGSSADTGAGGNRSPISNNLTASGFKPFFGATTRTCQSGRTYKWIAIWAPTS